MRKRITAIMLSAVMAASCLSAGTVFSFADSNGNPDGVYIRQISSGKCTLASATMMLRQKSLNEGNSTWKNITQESVRQYGWVEGVGIKSGFTYYGMTVKRVDFDGENRAEGILEILNAHPEGIEIYDRSVPHAVFLTRYDEKTDTFYCADPGLSDLEMALGDSWMKTLFSGATQSDILESVDSVYYISSYKKMNIPVYVSEDSDSGKEDESSTTGNSGSTGTTNGSTTGNTGSTGTTNGSSTGNTGSTGTTSGSTTGNTGSTGTTNGSTTDNSGSSFGLVDDNGRNPFINDNQIDIVYGTSGNEKFPIVKSYQEGLFKDADSTQWYMPYIRSVYERGLMVGTDTAKFGLTDSVSVAQAVTMAARISSVYSGDNYSFDMKAGDQWYHPYVRYAYSSNIISSYYTDDSVLVKPVTRAEFAEIISSALDDEICEQINYISDGQLYDVSERGNAGHAVYRLCRAGIITGDDKGNFNPSGTLNRVQLAAVIARVADASLRVEM